jgi:hypothetical protein
MSEVPINELFVDVQFYIEMVVIFTKLRLGGETDALASNSLRM